MYRNRELENCFILTHAFWISPPKADKCQIGRLPQIVRLPLSFRLWNKSEIIITWSRWLLSGRKLRIIPGSLASSVQRSSQSQLLISLPWAVPVFLNEWSATLPPPSKHAYLPFSPELPMIVVRCVSWDLPSPQRNPNDGVSDAHHH